jgi:hypothetical protein
METKGVPKDSGTWWPWGLAIGLGIALWLLASAVTGRREPWDSSLYWQLVYPLSLLGAMAVAWAHPARAWRWPFAVFLGQFLGVWLRNGEVGNLWPLAMAWFAMLAAPGVPLAVLAARWARRREARSA